MCIIAYYAVLLFRTKIYDKKSHNFLAAVCLIWRANEPSHEIFAKARNDNKYVNDKAEQAHIAPAPPQNVIELYIWFIYYCIYI